MLRFIVVLLYVALFLISTLPYYGVTWLMRKLCKDTVRIELAELRYVQWGFRVVLWLSGVKVTYIGDENIPDEAVLFASNHRGIYDIIACYAHVPNRTGFISKDSIKKTPILPFVMRRIYCLFLNRKDNISGAKTIIHSFDYMKKGVSIFIFPEGTRSRNDDPLPLGMFHNGSFKAAQRLGCPVVPVAIIGSEKIFEKHIPWIRAGKITVHFGKPVYYKDLTEEQKKNIGDTFADVVTSMIREDLPLFENSSN